MRKLIAGNWKMNGLAASLDEARQMAHGADRLGDAVDLLVCPPATLIDRLRNSVTGTRLLVGGQDCHAAEKGAHTGDVSADMLRDAGATFVILGHSERRTDHGESDSTVRSKVEAAFRAGLTPIVCVGETEAQRDSGKALDIVATQLSGSIPDAADRFVVAYEPVWAIGTGRTPTGDDIAAVHTHIRQLLVARFGEAGRSVPILYGGSMKPQNASEILAVPDVDGGLIGGASLKAGDFLAIAEAASA